MKKIFVISLLLITVNIQLDAQPSKRPCIKEGVLDGNNLSEKHRRYVTALEKNDTSVLMVPADVILAPIITALIIRSQRERWLTSSGLTREIALALGRGLDADMNRKIALSMLRKADIVKASWTTDDDVSASYIDKEDKLTNKRRPPYKGEIGLKWGGKLMLCLDEGCPITDSRGYNIKNNPGSRPPTRLPFVTEGPFTKDEVCDLSFFQNFQHPGDTLRLTDGRVVTLMVSRDSLFQRIAYVLDYYAKHDGWAKELPFSFSELSNEDILLLLRRSGTLFGFYKKGQLEIDAVNEKGEIVTYQRDSHLDVDINGDGIREAYLIFDPTSALELENSYKIRVYLSLHDFAVVKEVK